jgi:Fe2+ transport system protein FeoA
MSDKKPEKQVRNTRKIKRDTMSRQRVEQIQRSGIGEMRKRLYEMGITCMNDIK